MPAEIAGLSLMTRQRWDAYCLVATLCIAAASIAASSNPRAWSAPILGFVLWCFRYSIPRNGVSSRPIREYSPAMRRLIVLIALSLGLHPAMMLMRLFFRIDWILIPVYAFLIGVAFLLAHRADVERTSVRL